MTRTASVILCFLLAAGCGLTAPDGSDGDCAEGFERMTADAPLPVGAVPTMKTSTTRSSMTTLHRTTSASTPTTVRWRCVRPSPFSACAYPWTGSVSLAATPTPTVRTSMVSPCCAMTTASAGQKKSSLRR